MNTSEMRMRGVRIPVSSQCSFRYQNISKLMILEGFKKDKWEEVSYIICLENENEK